jgi:hypothetical protein
MNRSPIRFGRYRHNKSGTIYLATGLAIDSNNGPDNGRLLVIYKDEQASTSVLPCVRSIGEFTEYVETANIVNRVPRFELLPPTSPTDRPPRCPLCLGDGRGPGPTACMHCGGTGEIER